MRPDILFCSNSENVVSFPSKKKSIYITPEELADQGGQTRVRGDKNVGFEKWGLMREREREREED